MLGPGGKGAWDPEAPQEGACLLVAGTPAPGQRGAAAATARGHVRLCSWQRDPFRGGSREGAGRAPGPLGLPRSELPASGTTTRENCHGLTERRTFKSLHV